MLPPYSTSGSSQKPLVVVGRSSVFEVTFVGSVVVLSAVVLPSTDVVLPISTVLLSGVSVVFETMSVVLNVGAVSVELSLVTFCASVEFDTGDVVLLALSGVVVSVVFVLSADVVLSGPLDGVVFSVPLGDVVLLLFDVVLSVAPAEVVMLGST